MDKSFDHYLKTMPKKRADKDCDDCHGTGEMYAFGGEYIECYCLNSMTYMDDEQLAFYHLYIDKRSGKTRKGAKEAFIKNGLTLKKPTCRWCGLTKVCKSCKPHGSAILETLNVK